MRIAFIGQKGIPAIAGGVEKHVEEVAIRMAKEGHQVFAYVRNNYTDKKIREYKGVKLVHFPSIPTKNLDAITHTFLATVHALFQKYDVIHYQAIGPSSLLWIPKILKRQTLVVSTFHCQDYHHQKWGALARAYLKFGEWMTCRWADQVIGVSKLIKEYVQKEYNREIVFIPNGADVEYNPGTGALERWNLRDKKYILYVGRFIKHKGIHYLIEAFKNLEDKSKFPNNLKLVIVGDGFHTDDYVKEVHKLGEGRSNIIFTGSQTNGALEQLFSHAYLFVHPSESEGMSLALLEAMGYGLAPLVSDISENLETVQGEGFTFKNKNVFDLENQLAYLLNQPGEVEQAGKKAKELVKREYSWDAIVERTLKLYRDKINGKPAIKHKQVKI